MAEISLHIKKRFRISDFSWISIKISVTASKISPLLRTPQANLWPFTKFTNVSPRRSFPLYGIYLQPWKQ